MGNAYGWPGSNALMLAERRVIVDDSVAKRLARRLALWRPRALRGEISHRAINRGHARTGNRLVRTPLWVLRIAFRLSGADND